MTVAFIVVVVVVILVVSVCVAGRPIIFTPWRTVDFTRSPTSLVVTPVRTLMNPARGAPRSSVVRRAYPVTTVPDVMAAIGSPIAVGPHIPDCGHGWRCFVLDRRRRGSNGDSD
jgi:hypothetical protein